MGSDSSGRIEEAKAEIQTIANSSELATFDNTLGALERTGQTLDRLTSMFGVHAGNLNVGPIPEIESQVAQKLAAWHDSVVQNPELFARVKEVKDGDQFDGLTAVEQRLVEERFKAFVRFARGPFPRSTQTWPVCTQSSARMCWPMKKSMSPGLSSKIGLRVCQTA